MGAQGSSYQVQTAIFKGLVRHCYHGTLYRAALPARDGAAQLRRPRTVCRRTYPPFHHHGHTSIYLPTRYSRGKGACDTQTNVPMGMGLFFTVLDVRLVHRRNAWNGAETIT